MNYSEDPSNQSHEIDAERKMAEPVVVPEKPPREHEISNPEVPQLLTKHYTDQFWSTLGRTSVILIGWIGALLLIFIDPILQLPSDALKQRNSILEIDRRRSAAKQKAAEQKAAEKKAATPATSGVAATIEAPTPTQEAGPVRPVLSPDPARRNEATPGFQEQRQEAIEKLSKLRTPLGELNIRPVFAPLIWSVLFAGLLTFFLHKRIVLIAILAKVMQLRRSLQSDRPEVIRGLGSWAPFWLAPLPAIIDDGTLSEPMLREYLGWESTEKWRSRLTWLCIIAASIAHLFVAIAATLLVRSYRDPAQAVAICIAVYGVASMSVKRPR